MTNDDLLIFSKSLKALQDIIENNPEKEVSLRVLAEASGITIDQISRWFCIAYDTGGENQIIFTSDGLDMMPLLAMQEII